MFYRLYRKSKYFSQSFNGFLSLIFEMELRYVFQRKLYPVDISPEGGYHRITKAFKTKQLLFVWLLIFRSYHTKFIKHICQTTTNKQKNTHIISPLIISYNLAHSLNILKFANWPKCKGKQTMEKRRRKKTTHITRSNKTTKKKWNFSNQKRCRVERKKNVYVRSSDKQVAAAGAAHIWPDKMPKRKKC